MESVGSPDMRDNVKLKWVFLQVVGEIRQG